MKTNITLSLFSTIALITAALGNRDLCSDPNSNCDVVTINGNKAIRFKPDMGPGSEDYTLRFGNSSTQQQSTLESRANEIITSVNMGKTDMGWGCDDIIIEDILQELHWLCLDGPEGGQGACDEGSAHKMDVGWVTNSEYVLAELTIRAEGTYPSWAKHAFIDALRAIPPSGAVHTQDIWYTDHDWLEPSSEVCAMRRYPNWVQISKNEGNGLVGYMEVFAEAVPVTNTETCETILKVAGAIAGAVSGVLGGFFGIAEVACG
ncbi:uncharacterized protein BDV14DRAFT_196139 [Aspergillus stella-maris]|uniref:uncharacterized protein n=1 Tax=Aspergillus stella-maris TaxID=1810926 RepID=UPI003CCCB955